MKAQVLYNLQFITCKYFPTSGLVQYWCIKDSFSKSRGKWAFVHNLQTLQQNTSIFKFFSKMFLFFKLDFNKMNKSYN